jgi:hypothetical protein
MFILGSVQVSGPKPAPARTGTVHAKSGVTINPATGFVTDYLDHLDETVMLLELLATIPHVTGEFRALHLKSYREYVASLRGAQRKRAIAAYEAADRAACARLDMLVECMADVLAATREAMPHSAMHATGMMANRAAAWLRPLVAEASTLISGTGMRTGQILAHEQAKSRLGH